MKRLLLFIVAVGLAAACAQTEPQQPASAAPVAAPQTAAAPPSTAAPPATAPAPSPAPAPAQASTATATPTAAATTATPAVEAPAAAPVAQQAAPASAPPPKPARPVPTFREVTVPAGTELQVTVLSTLASNTSKVEDTVRGALAAPVVVGNTTALRKGAELRGSIIDAKASGRVKGKASLQFRFDRLTLGDETLPIQTARVTFEADDKTSDDVKKGGLGAGLGAAVGAIAGGGKGAAIGAVAGGAGTVMATKGREVKIAPGTPVVVLLQEALTLRVPIK